MDVRKRIVWAEERVRPARAESLERRMAVEISNHKMYVGCRIQCRKLGVMILRCYGAGPATYIPPAPSHGGSTQCRGSHIIRGFIWSTQVPVHYELRKHYPGRHRKYYRKLADVFSRKPEVGCQWRILVIGSWGRCINYVLHPGLYPPPCLGNISLVG